MSRSDRWLGAIEGYYGPPLTHDARLGLVRWMTTKGFNTYVYAPKDDPHHRQKWREPYPDDHMREFKELVECGREAGVRVGLTISPGLDWQDGDEKVLISKLGPFVDMGCDGLGILWDDVPPGGTELGAVHGRATAAAVEALGPRLSWWTVPTYYAVRAPTPYLEAFTDAVPPDVLVAWTGTSVVPARITGAEASSLGEALGRKLLLWENYPVNDGMMQTVLHLGPYPDRTPDLVDASSGVLFNFMSQGTASRLALAASARFWLEATVDRELAWRRCLEEFPSIEPLARACRSWLHAPGPDPELVDWADAAPGDTRLRSFLERGCRDGLDADLAAEVEPWLEAWEREAQLMLLCLDILEDSRRSVRKVMGATALWVRARRAAEQVFGIRLAGYPDITMGEDIAAGPNVAIGGDNLTDMLCRRALRGEE